MPLTPRRRRGGRRSGTATVRRASSRLVRSGGCSLPSLGAAPESFTMDTVAILGAGAWGTALAIHLARTHSAPAIRLWARDAAQVAALGAARENERYLPGAALPPTIVVTGVQTCALPISTLILVATPAGALRDVVALTRRWGAAPLFWAGKGFIAMDAAPGVGLAHRVVGPAWPAPVGVISGPSFAEEVARGLPTAVTIAASDPNAAENVAQRLRGETFRAYVSDDITGVEVGGAVKNVLAIAAGAADGLGFGHNARAALITRGLAEMARLATHLGAHPLTLAGLSGLGDLVLTCTGDLSRNRRVGLELARGKSLTAVLGDMHMVAEGVRIAK